MKHHITAASSEPRTNTEAEFRTKVRAKVHAEVRAEAARRGCLPPDPLDVEAAIEAAIAAGIARRAEQIAASVPPNPA
jgi:hypothetical protein